MFVPINAAPLRGSHVIHILNWHDPESSFFGTQFVRSNCTLRSYSLHHPQSPGRCFDNVRVENMKLLRLRSVGQLEIGRYDRVSDGSKSDFLRRGVMYVSLNTSENDP